MSGVRPKFVFGAKSQWNNFFEKMPAEGLFALRAHPFGVALKGDRRRCAASSNPACLCRGFDHYANSIPKSQWNNFFEKMPAEGFEPPTYGLQNRCTTTVLSRRGAGSYYSEPGLRALHRLNLRPGAGSSAAEDDRGKRRRDLRLRARGTARDIQIHRIPGGSPGNRRRSIWPL
jgi:hypothetical protein